MIVYAIVSLLCLLCLFVMACFNTAVDPSKAFKVNIIPQIKLRIRRNSDIIESTKAVKVKTLETRDLSDAEKRKRFMWFAILVMPPIVFVIVYLIAEA